MVRHGRFGMSRQGGVCEVWQDTEWLGMQVMVRSGELGLVVTRQARYGRFGQVKDSYGLAGVVR